MPNKTRVLIVDDSLVKQQLLQEALKGEDFEVVGSARNGEEAVRLCAQLKPDVITMDIHMPKLDGLEATRAIMSATPTPIVIVSATAQIESKFTTTALRYGALEFVPYRENWELFCRDLKQKLRVCAGVRVIRYIAPSRSTAKRAMAKEVSVVRAPKAAVQAVVVGASTGGPTALRDLFSYLPHPLSVPILVVQHMTQGFTLGLVNWLREHIPFAIHEVQAFDPLEPDHIYIAPGHAHMEVTAERRLRLSPMAETDIYKPSVDRLFLSAAQVFGQSTLAVVLTGMGKDGLEGARAVKEKGGIVITQDQNSSVVDGMPRAVREAGLSDYDVELATIPGLLGKLLLKR